MTKLVTNKKRINKKLIFRLKPIIMMMVAILGCVMMYQFKDAMTINDHDAVLVHDGDGKGSIPTPKAKSNGASFPQFKSIEQEVEDFMRKQKDTVGAHFISLLRTYLYEDPSWETERLSGCHKSSNLAKCLAGMKNYKAASQEDQQSGRVKMPFNEEGANTITAREMDKYRDTDLKISSLGTHTICLPLLLAGATVSQTGAIMELGPYTGFSSKCLAAGIRSTGPPRENSMFSYDTFKDYRSIIRSMNWMKKIYPDFSEENDSFLDLWKDSVQFVYPKAEPKEGFITTKNVHDGVLAGNSLDVLVIDSIKHTKSLHEQLGNLTIPAGAIFFTNDFQAARDNVVQIYGCFRGNMIPVFSSYIEPWAWVVTKTFNVNQSWVKKCYENIEANEDEARDIMIKQATADIKFLSLGLTNDESRKSDGTEYWNNRARDAVLTQLERGINWHKAATYVSVL